MQNKQPNLFIVGAARAGTTSLWYLLKQHPEVFMPADILWKEPSFFSNLTGMKDEMDYLSLFSMASGDEKYIGEASSVYLTDPDSAKRVHEFAPNAKIIIMLRNPVQRAYSLYNWMVQEGYEYSRTFEEALARESKRQKKRIPNILEPEYYYDYMYYSSGVYVPQIERYTEIFNPQNIFIGLFEDFIAAPERFMKEITDFLKITPFTFLLDKPQNPSRQVLHPFLAFVLRYITRILESIQEAPVKEKRDYLIKKIWVNKKIASMNPDTFMYLYLLYSQDYPKLESRYNLDLKTWRAKN